MMLPQDDLSTSLALVIDSNPTSRSILVNQLKDFGVPNVVHTGKLADARKQLEHRKFDVVLCEQEFQNESLSGQDLLDELRRNQLLPFSTVFIMVTGEATYAKVAEAAESALDGYLLKPHTASNLGDRLRQARVRKISLQGIFTAIEAEDFEKAIKLCQRRFEERGLFWLYAARVGAELCLRTRDFMQAQALYEAVVATKTLPWAKLGVARAQLDMGQTGQASTALQALILEEPGYSDAYDVLGRAQFEHGKFEDALATYKMASDLTPGSVTRLQHVGMMSFYAGDRIKAEKILDRTTRLGLDSKMFDCQSLVLLAVARLESGDRKGLKRCQDDFARLMERNPDSDRLRRLSGVVDALALIQQQQFAQAVTAVRSMAATAMSPEFDFESGANLLALMAELARKAIQLDELADNVDKIGMRFCTSRSLAEMLAGAAAIHPPYVERIRASQAHILKLTENAMTLSMAGDPKAAVKNLVFHGSATLNTKLAATAFLVLQRYATKISEPQHLTDVVNELRSRLGTNTSASPLLGDLKRQAGGLTLRTGGG